MDKRISQLDPAAALDGTEVLPVVQGGNTKKTAVSTILTWILGEITSDDISEGATNLYLNQTNFDSFWDLKALGDLSDVDLTGLNANDVLQWDGANWIPYAIVAADNIYTADGTLTGYRTVDCDGNTLYFQSSQVKIGYDDLPVGSGTLVVGCVTDSVGFRVEGSGGGPTLFFVQENDNEVGVGTALTNVYFNVYGTLKFVTGAQGVGKVLTSDANGVADWATPVSGVTTFLALTDTPATYVGQTLKSVRVNAGETALEFVSLGGVGGAALNGGGTAGYVARWQDTDTLISGAMRDNGSQCAIGTVPSPSMLLQLYNSANTLTTGLSSVNTDGGVLGSVRNLLNNGTQQLEMGILGTGCTGYAVLRGGQSDSFIVHKGNAGNLNIRTDNGSTGNIQFFSRKDADQTPSMIIDGNSVGIGTTSPSEILEVTGNIKLTAFTNTYKIATGTAIGISQAFGESNVFVGNATCTDADNGGAIALGYLSKSRSRSIAIGMNANADTVGTSDSMAIGTNSVVNAGVIRGVAIGNGAIAAFNETFVIGVGATSTIPNAIILGSSASFLYNVGIATPSPTSRLQVKTALGGSGFRVDTNGGSPVIYTNDSGMTGFGTASPNPSAIVDITSTTQGFLPPRMTATQASAIPGVDGLMVYVSTTNGTFTSVGFWGYVAGVWEKLNN